MEAKEQVIRKKQALMPFEALKEAFREYLNTQTEPKNFTQLSRETRISIPTISSICKALSEEGAIKVQPGNGSFVLYAQKKVDGGID